MNPLTWRLELQIAGAMCCVVGAMAGVFFAWMESPFRRIANSNISGEWSNSSTVFLQWLSYPHLYWVWPFFGGLIAALAFYAFMLTRKPER